MTTQALALGLLPPVNPAVVGQGVGCANVVPFKTSWQALAPLASPVFTGDPRAPTPAVGDNDTSIATTAYVQAALVASVGGVASFNTRVGAVTLALADVTTAFPGSAAPPAMNGAVAPGVSNRWSHDDHVHPSDTSRLALSGGVMTGALTLSADPGGAMQAVTLQYLQANTLNSSSVIDCGTY